MKTDDAILKEVFDNNMIGTETKIKKAISLTRKAERKRILELIRKIAKDEIKSLKHEKNHPVNKALGEDTYKMELEIAEWEDFLNTFENIQDKLKEFLKKEVEKK